MWIDKLVSGRSQAEYEDGNMELSAVHGEKDLGVYFTSDLKPSTQCIKAAQQRQEESLEWCAEISRGWTKKTSWSFIRPILDRTWNIAYRPGHHI